MDLNLVVLAGRLAAPPTLEMYAEGDSRARLLITVRGEHPIKRVDVVPVIWMNPTFNPRDLPRPGQRVWVAGAVRRTFLDKNSRLEIVANQVEIRDEETADV
jgi:hypothetical protein